MKEEKDEFIAILIVGGSAIIVAFLLGILNESFREWFSYFLCKIPVWF